MEILEVEVDAIKTGDWLRKDPGDLEGLAGSLDEHGELRPIVVTPDLRLVAGGRQLGGPQAGGLQDGHGHRSGRGRSAAYPQWDPAQQHDRVRRAR